MPPKETSPDDADAQFHELIAKRRSLAASFAAGGEVPKVDRYTVPRLARKDTEAQKQSPVASPTKSEDSVEF